MQKLLVIKLGGVVVTYKDSPTPKVRVEVLKSLALEIQQIADQKKYQVILVHGAGYVHNIVKKGNIQFGMKTPQQKKAFLKAIDSMSELNNIVVKYLLAAKLSVAGVSPHAFVTQSAGKLKSFKIKIVKEILDHGQIPVLSPDMVLDDKWGCSVLSGDTIVAYLAKKLKADQVIFLSDVDGIYTSDPKKNPTAKLITKITNKNFKNVLRGLTQNNPNDTSGEMKGKVLSIKQHLTSVPVLLANGLKPGNLLKAVGQSPIGTKLHFN